MADYTRVSDELKAGTPPDVLCATCPWDRLCVQPPSMSKAELDRKMSEAEAKDRVRPGPDGMPVQTLMTVAMFTGMTTSGQLCPVFAQRLAGPDGRGTADAIRAHMRDGA